MNDEWREWIKLNLSRGCNPEELAGILKTNGFEEEEIRLALTPAKSSFIGRLKQKFSQRLEEAKAQVEGAEDAPEKRIAQPGFDYKKMAAPKIISNPSAVQLDDSRIQLYVFDNFMSEKECAGIMREIDQDLRPSTITSGKDYSGFRTSSTCDLGLNRSQIVDKIDKKIARVLGVRLAWSETIQGQKYEVGQEFKAHTDYFEPNSKEFENFASDLGQRTWTFMVYLNDTPEGGETRFTALDVEFKPKAGQALIWNNLYSDGQPNPDTMHHGMPVKAGTKKIITKWFRDKGKGHPYFSNK